MSIVKEVYEALGGVALPLAVLALAAAVAVLNLVFRAMRADIGQYSFRGIGGWHTFFLKNFNSVCYRSELRVRVEADGDALDQVIVHAGPSCREPPVKVGNGVVEVRFTEVPADASFVIRARTHASALRLYIPAESPLQSRAFDRPIVATTTARRVARYLVGTTTMIGVFAFGLCWRSEEIWGADYALIGAAVLLSVFSFWLVTPLEGKSIVAGYIGWGDTGTSWARDAMPERAAAPMTDVALASAGAAGRPSAAI